MPNAECGIERAGLSSISHTPGSTSALQFRIPHFTFRISLLELVQLGECDLSRRLAGAERAQLRAVRCEARAAHCGAQERVAQVDVPLLGHHRSGARRAVPPEMTQPLLLRH